MASEQAAEGFSAGWAFGLVAFRGINSRKCSTRLVACRSGGLGLGESGRIRGAGIKVDFLTRHVQAGLECSELFLRRDQEIVKQASVWNEASSRGGLHWRVQLCRGRASKNNGLNIKLVAIPKQP